ncbi:MAG: 50S ribosomal protein L18 [Desulfurococcaceae archaeon TW002]
MGRGPTYKVPFRRRREGKTNYYKRYRMVKSGRLLRAVIRKTNTQVIVQIVKFSVNGDETVVGVSSKSLRKYGWLGDLNNTSAAYLTGLLAGVLAIKKNVKEVIPDIGLHKASKGARVFAAMKGLLDAGVQIPVSEEVIPSQERIEGQHIAEYARKLSSENEDLFRRYFGEYLKRGLDPHNLLQHFREVREKILNLLSSGEEA